MILCLIFVFEERSERLGEFPPTLRPSDPFLHFFEVLFPRPPGSVIPWFPLRVPKNPLPSVSLRSAPVSHNTDIRHLQLDLVESGCSVSECDRPSRADENSSNVTPTRFKRVEKTGESFSTGEEGRREKPNPAQQPPSLRASASLSTAPSYQFKLSSLFKLASEEAEMQMEKRRQSSNKAWCPRRCLGVSGFIGAKSGL